MIATFIVNEAGKRPDTFIIKVFLWKQIFNWKLWMNPSR